MPLCLLGHPAKDDSGEVLRTSICVEDRLYWLLLRPLLSCGLNIAFHIKEASDTKRFSTRSGNPRWPPQRMC